MAERALDEALTLDAERVDALRRGWLTLMAEAAWSNTRGARPGVGGRVGKRALETGERLRGLAAAREWIPRPRERLKNALASAMSVDGA